MPPNQVESIEARGAAPAKSRPAEGPPEPFSYKPSVSNGEPSPNRVPFASVRTCALRYMYLIMYLGCIPHVS